MRTVVRILTAVLCVLLVGGLAYGAELVPRPSAQEVEFETTEITSNSIPLICPGPAQLAEGDWDRDAAYDPSPVGTTSAIAGIILDPSSPAEPGLRNLAGEPLVQLSTGLDAWVAGVASVEHSAFWLRPDVRGIARGAGVASSVTTGGDLRGLGAMSCGPAEVEQWLVGGSTVLGTSSRLVLQNPSRTPASVQIEVWGPTGRLELAGPSTFSVPAGGQTATLLEGLASEQRRLTVRVVSSGALVSSYLQVNELDGLRPLGTDFVAPSSAPVQRQVITGLTVQDSEIGDEAAASIRLLAPGADAADVSVTILGERGRMLLPGTERVDLAPGAVTDVSLAGLPAGTYSAVIESDEPVVAGGRFARQATTADGAEGGGPALQPTELAFVGSRAIGAPELVDQTGDRADDRLAGPGESGVVALPRSGSAAVNLLLVPHDVRSVAAASGDGVDDDSGVGDVASPVEATVVLLDVNGHSLGASSVELAPGLVHVFDPAEFAAGQQVAAVYVTTPAESGSSLSWSVLARAGESGDELVSVLLPVPAIDTHSQIILRPGLSTGLGTRTGAEHVN